MSTANKTKKSLQFLTTKTITPEIRRALYCGQLVLLKNLKSANELVHYFSSNFTSTATLQSAWEKVEKKKVTNELTSTASVKVRETEKEEKKTPKIPICIDLVYLGTFLSIHAFFLDTIPRNQFVDDFNIPIERTTCESRLFPPTGKLFGL